MDDMVRCHSETTYPERPLEFDWGGGVFTVSEVLQRWRSPNGQHFTVITMDQQIFELFYSLSDDSWQVDQL